MAKLGHFHRHSAGSQEPVSADWRAGFRNDETASNTCASVRQDSSSVEAIAAYAASQNAGGGGTAAGTGWVARNSNVLSMARSSDTPSRGPVVARSARSGRSLTREFGLVRGIVSAWNFSA